MDQHKTLIRGLESFLFVLISSFLSQLVVTGQQIDITDPASQSGIVTALLAAFGIAFRQVSATRSGG
jgi:CII-binding regulator of phage lambda lysogenization HflD